MSFVKKKAPTRPDFHAFSFLFSFLVRLESFLSFFSSFTFPSAQSFST